MGCPSLLQWVFLTQGLYEGLPHCRQILYHLSHQGSPLQMNIWLLWVLVAALVIFSCYTWDLSSLTRDQTQALFWECRVLATGPAGTSPALVTVIPVLAVAL